MRIRHLLVRSALLSLATLGSVGCTDAMGPDTFELEEPAVEAAGIYPSIEVGTPAASTTPVQVHFRRVKTDARIGSFQGEVVYRTELGTVARAELPEGITGSWNEVEPGRLRFAGAAVGPVADGAVLTLYLQGGRAPRDADFTLKIEEITAPDQFSNLTSMIVETAAR